MKRPLVLVVAPLVFFGALTACSSKKDGPVTTVPVVGATVNGQRSPNVNGNNSGNDKNPSPSDAAPAPADTNAGGSTFDTQEKIGDNSP